MRQVFNSSNVGFAMAEIEDDDEDEDHGTVLPALIVILCMISTK